MSWSDSPLKMEWDKMRQISQGKWKKKKVCWEIICKGLGQLWNWDGSNCLLLLDGNGESFINHGLGIEEYIYC
jgi:hypothetical protein